MGVGEGTPSCSVTLGLNNIDQLVKKYEKRPTSKNESRKNMGLVFERS